MMHASTSPQYAIIASNDVSAAMMDGAGGTLLTGEAISEAISFRQTVARLQAGFSARGEWFFSVWQPPQVKDGARELPFAEAPPALLAEDQKCWLLEPDAAWHGFNGLEPGYAMLDPIKVTIVTPGMTPTGELTGTGIPAPLLTSYLAEHGIVAEKTANFSILFLFSIGVTKGKWGSLINAMLDFKRDYDANTPLARAMPQLTAANTAAYGAMGLRDLAAAMFTAMREGGIPALLQDAYMTLPPAACTPADAYDRLVQGECQRVPLYQMASGIAATALVPYPPGIPLVMPGESLGESDGPELRYLAALRVFDRQFPGFGHDTHGIEMEAGEYYALRF